MAEEVETTRMVLERAIVEQQMQIQAGQEDLRQIKEHIAVKRGALADLSDQVFAEEQRAAREREALQQKVRDEEAAAAVRSEQARQRCTEIEADANVRMKRCTQLREREEQRLQEVRAELLTAHAELQSVRARHGEMTAAVNRIKQAVAAL